LVIDDEPDITRFVRRGLESTGHEVLTAVDGLGGLQAAVSGSIDLIILDLLMPGIDGLAVLAGVIAHNPQQRVIVLSAVVDVETRVRCLEQGAVDFVGKPFALRELVARVRCRLREPVAPNGRSILQTERLTLDLRRREARFGDQVTALSSREFLLLSHLMRNKDVVCSREEILSEVWGYDFDPGTNVVDVYVRRLRRKVPQDYIKTVRNVGYQLESA
ncbi:MAG: response regulator transcription factor, partial [Candidatus Nanopelagicales bacterium]